MQNSNKTLLYILVIFGIWYFFFHEPKVVTPTPNPAPVVVPTPEPDPFGSQL